MVDIIEISSNTTTGEIHDGALLWVTSGVTITLPKETTYAYQIGDGFKVAAGTGSTVTINGEGGVTLSPNGTEQIKGAGLGFSVVYAGSDEYLVFGVGEIDY